MIQPTSAAEPDDAVEVGRIIGAWGVKGWFKVQAFATEPQALFSSRRWFLRPPEEPRVARPVGNAAYPPYLKIAESREHGEWVVARTVDVVDRSGAEALRGARVFVPRASFPTAGADEFYWVDLMGLAVVNRLDEPLGSVVGLIDTGAHSVLRVLPEGAQGEAAERLIPFVAQYIDEVSLEQRRIRVDWGLDF
ncbi:MAG TPA: ribosome maturation factor RimM [Piscinibacter sp.]|uniref:ribosome maturation factor RimM n=1 Tax=Piscinibacter sp. TaxID=1903157 RepID=UPI0025CC3260|nr:ribosome maturation factor RimM [Piscinibacter sp.]HOY34170.1 ribosome maturation factor RimM [Piscinibacter sp.]HPG77793.1 ribosome maturation factor RimM [Piscinibacter sp.]HPM66765.1 ribosome maturation factor RimM [Piscinibacter sp.]